LIRSKFFLACWLAAAAAAEPLHAATNASKAAGAQEELRELKSRIEAIQKRLAEAEESKSEAADALRESERAISDANRAVSDLVDESRAANTRVSELKRDISRTSSELEQQRAAAAKLLYQQYTNGRPEALAILLKGGDPNAMARDLHYLTYIGRARSELIAKLGANRLRLEQLADEAGSKASELAALTAEHTRQRRKLEQEKRTRAEMLTRISRDIEGQRREIGTLKRDEARLARLVDQLAKMIARTPKPSRAPEKRPSRESRSAEPRRQNDRVPEPDQRQDGAFSQLRGKLALPVRGELANRFGSPRQDGGVVWKGLFIAARGGEEVRAIAAGRVVFADWLRGFGNLLIIDHGDSYMTLYGYNETLYRQVGDVIRGGDRVAAVGNTGGHPESGLYFEMRHEGRPFDPMSWVVRK
jgi:septal ring factor EnvC (AmiA/AmiB activator)